MEMTPPGWVRSVAPKARLFYSLSSTSQLELRQPKERRKERKREEKNKTRRGRKKKKTKERKTECNTLPRRKEDEFHELMGAPRNVRLVHGGELEAEGEDVDDHIGN